MDVWVCIKTIYLIDKPSKFPFINAVLLQFHWNKTIVHSTYFDYLISMRRFSCYRWFSLSLYISLFVALFLASDVPYWILFFAFGFLIAFCWLIFVYDAPAHSLALCMSMHITVWHSDHLGRNTHIHTHTCHTADENTNHCVSFSLPSLVTSFQPHRFSFQSN